MKKLFVLLLCLLFPMVTNAKDDKITIEKLDTYIMILDMDFYSYEESVDTRIIYGEKPATFYYEKSIPTSGIINYKFNNRKAIYNAEISQLDVLNKYYSIDNSNKGITNIKVGSENIILNESEKFDISYNIKYSGDKLLKNMEYNFPVANSKYDIKKVDFEIILTEDAKEGTILFSNDGKNYKEKLDGLSYNIEYSSLKGTYNKMLSGNDLSIKVVLKNGKADNTNLAILIVYVSLFLFMCSIVVITIKMFIYKKKKATKKRKK